MASRGTTENVRGRVQGAPGTSAAHAGVGFYRGPQEQLLGTGVRRESPARLSSKKRSKSDTLVAAAMEEVHEHEPSTVTRADVSGKKKERMLRAIALSKARARGAKIPRRKES